MADALIKKFFHIPRMLSILLTILLGFILTACHAFISVGTFSFPSKNYVIEAEDAERNGEFDKAIGFYEKHIEERLNAEKRPSWENPYFYLIKIADLYLKKEKSDDAIASIEKAEAKDVEKSLIADRYRAIANWLSSRQQYMKALDLLKKHRELDQLLIDTDLDRISKEMIQQEDQNLN